VFKGGIVLVIVLGALLLVWIIKSLSGPAPAPATARGAAPSGGEMAETATSAPAATVSVVALETVRIKVVRKSDNVELFQGSLLAGERREFPNVPIFLTASELGAVQIDYKGHRYPTGHAGYERIQFDFSNR